MRRTYLPGGRVAGERGGSGGCCFRRHGVDGCTHLFVGRSNVGHLCRREREMRMLKVFVAALSRKLRQEADLGT